MLSPGTNQKLKEINRKCENREKLTTEDLKYFLKAHQLPANACACQKNDNSEIIIDVTKCNQIDVAVWGKNRYTQNLTGSLKDYCNGTYAQSD
jgi:hypothetical protein